MIARENGRWKIMLLDEYQDRRYRQQAFNDVEQLKTYLNDFLDVNRHAVQSSLHQGRYIERNALRYWGRAIQFMLKGRLVDAQTEARIAAAFFLWSVAIEAARHSVQVTNLGYEYAKIMTGVPSQVQHHFNKFGSQRVSALDWLAIITEEWGETVEEILASDIPAAVKEAQQTLACISRFITELKRMRNGTAEREYARYTRAV